MAAGCEKERERARSKSAWQRTSDRWIGRTVLLQLSVIAGGDKQPPPLCSSFLVRCRAPMRAQVRWTARDAWHKRRRQAPLADIGAPRCADKRDEAIMVEHVGPSACGDIATLPSAKQYHVRERASSGTAEVTSSYHCLEKSISAIRFSSWFDSNRRPQR